MIKGLSFGQYTHKDSAVHSLDCRLKIAYVVVLSILAFAVKNVYEILLFTMFIFSAAILAKIGFKSYIKNLRAFYSLFIFILLMYILFSRNNLSQGLMAIWRFWVLITISVILTFSTTTSSLIAGIKKLSRPLKIFGLNPRNLALLISMAIRFVPVMFVNMEKAKEAMLSRLANFRELKSIKLLMLVLLEKMFKSASNLSDALQSRLYDENVESQKALKLQFYDYLSLAIILSLAIAIY